MYLSLISILFICFKVLAYDISLTRVTPERGVAISSVMSIAEDKHGMIWFGTNNGVFKYDTQNFKKYSYSKFDKHTLPTNRINQIYNHNDSLIIVTEEGLCIYNPHFDNFHDLIIKDVNGKVLNGDFSHLTQTKDGMFWLLDKEGLFSFNEEFITGGYKEIGNSKSRPRLLHLDNQDNLWTILRNGEIYFKPSGSDNFLFFSKSLTRFARSMHVDNTNVWVGFNDHGLYCYDLDGKLLREYNEDNGFIGNNIRSIVRKDENELWIGTYNGIAIMHGTEHVKSLTCTNNPHLHNHSVWSMYKDSKDILWIGTWLGGLFNHSDMQKSVTVTNRKMMSIDSDYDIINSFAQEANNGPVWVGSESGHLKKYDFTTNTESFHKVSYRGKGVESIKTLAIDKYQTLWIGTYEQGIFYKKKNETDYSKFKIPFKTGLQITSILPTDKGIWVSDYQQGIFFSSFEGKNIKRYRHNYLDNTTIASDCVRKIIQDKHGNLWLATESGLDFKAKDSNKFEHIIPSETGNFSATENFIYSVLEDKNGNIWIGTNGGGLIKYDVTSKECIYIGMNNGLPINNIYTILEGENNCIWLATSNGIYKYNTVTKEYTNYKDNQTLSESIFNNNAGIVTDCGRIFWGCTDGYFSYMPSDISVRNTIMPQTTITNFYLNNQEVLPQNGSDILNESISETTELTIDHRSSIFSFKFVTDNYISPQENRFEYRLLNFDKEWIETDQYGMASFTNIPPGKYTFEVRAANNDGVWNKHAVAIHITITPPWYASWYALLAYALLLVFIVWEVTKEINNRRRLTEQLRIKKVEHESEEKLHQMKLKFFTNISHEFRTPLTLIIGPVERIIRQIDTGTPLANQLGIVKNNADRMLRLVNQILDFRKINAGKMTLKPYNNDIVKFSHAIFDCFNEHARHRNFEFTFNASSNHILVDFDNEKLDKIIFNILSNAFKYSEDNGKIDLQINGNVSGFSEAPRPADLILGESELNDFVEIIISDHGHGISNKGLPLAFERFRQVDETATQGSGIGLSLTKDYLLLHAGMLKVSSQKGSGSTFTILLPTHQEATIIPDTIESVPESQSDFVQQATVSTKTNKQAEQLILLVEDNIELIDYLSESLKDQYKIAKAKNGIEGLLKARSLHPDMIISDVMMPEMDGIEFCKAVKEDIHTSHIPVILLTALESTEDQVTGLASGADAYISKPFSLDLLLAQMSNLLHSRKVLRDNFDNKESNWEEKIEATDIDKQLIIKAVRHIETNISNPDISVDDLASALNLSRTTLHRKLKSLSNQSATEFIRNIRLQNAATLFTKHNYKVNEVADMVGFNSMNYFTRSFKANYGKSPRDFIKEHKES